MHTCIPTYTYIDTHTHTHTHTRTYTQATGARERAAAPADTTHGEPFKYTHAQARKGLHAQLFSFVRLCDYMVFEAIKTCVLLSTTRLCSRIGCSPAASRSASDAPPLLVVHVSLAWDQRLAEGAEGAEGAERGAGRSGGQARLVLAPVEEEVGQVIEGIAESFVRTVGAAAWRLLDHPELSRFYSLHAGDESMSDAAAVVRSIIVDTSLYARLREQLRRGVDACFAQADAVLAQHAPLAALVSEHRALDAARMVADAEAQGTVWEMDALLALEAGFQRQLEQMLAVEDYHECAALRLALGACKRQLAAWPRACIEQVRAVIPRLLARQERELLDRTMLANAALQATPALTDLAGYIAFYGELDRLDKEQDELDEKLGRARRWLATMRQHGMAQAEPDRVTSAIMEADARKLKTTMLSAWEWQEANHGQFLGVVSGLEAALLEGAGDLKLLADDAQLRRAPLTADDIALCVATLADLGEQVAALEAQADRVRGYQRALRRPVGAFEELGDLAQDVALKAALWDAVAEADGLWHGQARAQGRPHCAVAADEEEARIARWGRLAQRGDKKLQYSNMERASGDTLPHHLRRTCASHRALVRTRVCARA